MSRAKVLASILACLTALPAVAQDKDESHIRENVIGNKTYDVVRCSVEHNEKGLKGPIKLRITTNKQTEASQIEVLSKKHRGTDLEKCIMQSATISDGSTYPSITFTHSFEFHPWAEKSRRKWEDVRKVVEDAGVVEALQTCRNTHEERFEDGTTYFHFFIRPSGTVRPVFKSPDTMNECLEKAIQVLPTFAPAGNNFVVLFEIQKGKQKPFRFEGNTVEPHDCELNGRTCSYAEADPAMTKWSFELMDRAVKEKKLNCENIEEVAAWLREQEHVESVSVGGCSLLLQVKGTVSTGYHGHRRH